MFLKIIIALIESVAVTLGGFHSVWRLQNSNYRLTDYFLVAPQYYILCFSLGGAALAVWILGLEVKLLELALAAVFLTLSVTVSHNPPLKFTPRIKRQFAVTTAVLFAVCFFLPLFAALLPAHLWMLLGFLIILPFETLNNRRYINTCKEALVKNNAVKVAVVGSYAKTSVKNYLTVMLKEKFTVAATPDSVNTPLGISKFVNGGGLNGAEICVFEFGARRRGDIAELCRLVNPDAGILTGVAPQHLKTFKSFENVIKTKTEILNYLDKNKFCAVNAADENLTNISSQCEMLYAAEENGCAYAENLVVKKNGSAFDLILNGERLSDCRTSLIGAHNITNICVAAAAASRLGVNSEKIKAAVEKLRPVPHRLEILPSRTGIIIDDSYNANLVGIKAAADALRLFPGKKYVITQGVAECGKRGKELNTAAGEILAAAVDKAAVTGKNAKYLAAGLIKGGLSEENVLHAETVADAVNLIKPYLNAESALLFQNDLPK